MKKIFVTCPGMLASLLLITNVHARNITAKEDNTSHTAAHAAMAMQDNASLSFIENKGQIKDQHGNYRNDIDYKLDAGSMVMFIGDGQIHYQWSKTIRSSPSVGPAAAGRLAVDRHQVSGIETYRMDVELLDANKNAIAMAAGEQTYVENYYLPQCPDGVTAHSYSMVTYKNVYPGIDWVVYMSPHPASPQGGSDGMNRKNKKGHNITSPLGGGQEGASLKYDFIVHPGGDPSRIKLRYNGARSLQLKNGALIAETPYGSITENAPYSYYANTKEQVTSAFKLNGNILSYNITSPLGGGREGALVIDPTLIWATYYGGSGDETGGAIAADSSDNVYQCGSTNSTGNIATTGAYQSTFGGTSTSYDIGGDAFAVKFDSSGARIWATYCGGPGYEGFYSVAADTFGNVYFSGSSDSTGLATAGAYKTAGAGILITKFSAATGTRQWATYYIDSNYTYANIICDRLGNLYALTVVDSPSTTLATSGAFQTALTVGWGALLTKFSGSGSRLWATYYNGTALGLGMDGSNNVYISGYTRAATGVATTGAYKPTVSGIDDNGFLAKFSPSGARLWGTYYGDVRTYINSIACDANGNVYAGGNTQNTTGIATPGTFRSTISGMENSFIVKFNSTGTRQWGTYFGDVTTIVGYPYPDAIWGLECDKRGNIVGAGWTALYNTIHTLATPDAYQSTVAGDNDFFFFVFNANGSRRYCTYFGGPAYEMGVGNSFNSGKSLAVGLRKAYISGSTASTSGISAGNAYQSIFAGFQHTSIIAGQGDLCLAQFQLDTQVYIKQPLKDTLLCGLDTLHIPYGVFCPFRSTNTFTFQLSDAGGSFASPTGLGTASGTQRDSIFKWRVPANITAGTGYRVRILASAPVDTAYEENNITLRPRAVITAGSNSPICSGNDLNLTAPATITGVTYSWTGPAGFSSALPNPTRTNAQTAHSGKYVVTTTINGCTYKDSIVNVVVNMSPAATIATSNSPICEGADLNFTVTNTVPAVVFSWTGPGFTSSLPNPVIASAAKTASGIYNVTSTLGTCTTSATLNVAVNVGPTIFVYPSPDDSMCTGKKLTMVGLATPPSGGTTFQWQKGGVNIPGATAGNYSPPTVTNGDIYSVKMIPAASYGCSAPINSNGVTITVLPDIAPSVIMTASDTNSWPGLQIAFTAAATDAGTFPRYQWKLNGKNVLGATGNTWSAATLNNNDSVCIEVTSTYLCPVPATATACKRVKIATGIHDAANSKLRIYPNPASTQVTIEGLSLGTKIQLNDVYGRALYEGIANQSTTTVNIQNLIPGNYILQITDTNGTRSSYKLVKQ